ncbi:MAG: hypothetical protein MUF51_10630, partial [Vicinamibacteria bacterium]|nr:hypothetical protein [Vicinamibacteria bacterium]
LRGRGVSVRAGDCPDATHVKIAQPKASDFIEHYQEMIVRALRRTPQPRNKKKEVRHAKASLDSLNRDGADRRWLRKKRK